MISLLFISLWLLWIVFMLYDAYEEAYLYYYGVKSKLSIKELHPAFFTQRLIVAIIIIIPTLLITPIIWYKIILFLCSLILCQPFFHNGMYYLTRNKLDNKTYPKKWFAMSTTSTAKSTKFFTPTNRIIFFIISIIFLIITFF